MELLSVIFEVIVSLIVGLLKFDEFLSLLEDLIIVAVPHVKLLVLDTFTLFGQDRVNVLFEVFSIFSLENLLACHFHQSLLLTINKKVPRLLECNCVVT